jgi:hypothetical protein
LAKVADVAALAGAPEAARRPSVTSPPASSRGRNALGRGVIASRTPWTPPLFPLT